MGFRYFVHDGNSIKYSVRESGIYNLALIQYGEISWEEVEIKLNKSLEYFVEFPEKGRLSQGFEFSMDAFGRFGDTSEKAKTLKFIHIPKNAGTSIEDFGYFSGLKWGRIDRKYLSSIGFDHHTPLYESGDVYPDYDKFCVVRNPYNRLISIVYCRYNKFYPLTIGEFNQYIVDSIEKYNRREKYDNSAMWIPQKEFVYLDNQKIVDHVIKFENLKEEIGSLFSQYEMKSQFNQTSNRSHKKKSFGIQDLYPETLDLFNKTYAKDFEYFGYEMI